MPVASKKSVFPYIFLSLSLIIFSIVTYSYQFERLNLKYIMSNSTQYYQNPGSILKLPVENNQLKLSKFELIFDNNSLTYFEKEANLKDVQQVSASRMKNLENFCKNWRYNRTIDDVLSITIFGSERTYECRVPKTGQC